MYESGEIMKIAICDDTPSDLENLKNCLVEYLKEKQIPYSIDGFNDCNVLLNRIKYLDSNEYDLFILDVIMQKNGIDIAKEIRKFNDKSVIILKLLLKNSLLMHLRFKHLITY